MDIFNKEHFTKKQLEVAKDFEKARKQLDKYNLILNDNGGKLQLFTKKDWQESDGYPNSISSVIQIDGWINDSCDC